MESRELEAIRQRDLHWCRLLTSPDIDPDIVRGFNSSGEDRRMLLRVLDGLMRRDPRPQPEEMRALLESLESPQGPRVSFVPRTALKHEAPTASAGGPTDPVIDFVAMRSLQLELSAEGLNGMAYFHLAEHCRTSATLLRALALAASQAAQLLNHLVRTQTYPQCCASDFGEHVTEWIKKFTVAALVAPTDGK